MENLTHEQKLFLLEHGRKKTQTLTALRKSCFKEQLEFIDDPCKKKAIQCTRRAGKSYGAGINLIDTCIRYPRSTCLYIATTREQARRIMLKDILREIDRTYHLDMRVNLTTLTVSFPSESLIYLMGLDSKPEEMQKAFGQKYRLVYIDEAGSWKQDQKELIYSILEPACADYGGTIVLAGSPVNSTKTHFFDITGRKEADPGYPKGWSVHRWSWQQNPHVRRAMQKQIDTMIEANPLIVETPAFQQMYMNIWVIDLSALCYKYDPIRNSIDEATFQQKKAENKLHYSLGLDLGYEDDTAISICGYSEYDSTMYVVDTFKQKKLNVSAVADILTNLEREYRPYKWVVDGANKQVVMELRDRYNFPFEPADKQGKFEMVQVMNADFIQARIKVRTPRCEELEDEYKNLIWDARSLNDPKARTVEHSACANHLADATLYSWRECYHYAATAETKAPRAGSDEFMDAWWDKEARKLQRRDTHGEDWLMQDCGEQYGFLN